MKAWRPEKAGSRFALEERPIPEPRTGGVVIRMRAAPVVAM
jgi:NADPH:quinone reductase-like Zn-dependent oxidoreductase